ncbi:MAG: hypothetical protein AB7V40_07625 [Methyloceanibacter sp.]
MRKFLAIALTASAGATLAACTDQPPSSVNSPASNSLAYERPAPVTRAPLAPPTGYASNSAPPAGYGSSYGPPPPLGAPYGSPPAPAPYPNPAQYDADAQTAALGWQKSPRWSAVEGDGCIEVEPGGPEGQMRIDRCAKQSGRSQPPAPDGTLAPRDD